MTAQDRIVERECRRLELAEAILRAPLATVPEGYEIVSMGHLSAGKMVCIRHVRTGYRSTAVAETFQQATDAAINALSR